MQLRRLEEERKLQEKRDRDYIEKKYGILNQLNSDDEQDSIAFESIVNNGVSEWVSKTTWPEEKYVLENKNAHVNFCNSGLASRPRDKEASRTHNDLKGEVPVLNKTQIRARLLMSKDQLNFSGRPEEWPLFISWWNNSSQSCGFRSYENMLHLQRCLKEKALEAVRFRLLPPDQVDGVIETLKMLYGRPELIIELLLEKNQK